MVNMIEANIKLLLNYKQVNLAMTWCTQNAAIKTAAMLSHIFKLAKHS